MKEDILEQLVEDWYVTSEGWFVKHNIKYRPDVNHNDYDSKKDSVHSDIDILAFSAKEKKSNNVHVISCKSWQAGLDLKNLFEIINQEATYNDKSKGGFQKREGWKGFRELVSDKWISAFINKIEKETGQRNFIYRIAVTKIKEDRNDYLSKILDNKKIKERFKKHNSEIKVEIIELKKIIEETLKRVEKKETTALEMTEVGRFVQLLKAANIDIK
ncbi:hypothetical protein [uncultured Fibrobacter sp.]|uniref:hypothetical protein n=1 Tax=uncultured Fibrobacter sp. TaxID=261512 RepID=UPI0025EC5A20|nr:hypothetical protein [uncultured Fibrobacter sp.]